MNDRIRQYMPLVKNRARRYHRGWVAQSRSREDLEAIGIEAVWRAEQTYRDDQGATFGTYVTAVVNHAMTAEQKHLLKHKRRGITVSITEGPDGELPVELTSSSPRPDALLDAADVRRVVRDAVDALAPRLKEIVERRFWRDETLQQIGTSWGITRERIRQLELSALDILRPRLKCVWAGTGLAT